VQVGGGNTASDSTGTVQVGGVESDPHVASDLTEERVLAGAPAPAGREAEIERAPATLDLDATDAAVLGAVEARIATRKPTGAAAPALPVSGVLGAHRAKGPGFASETVGTLPFTGFELWILLAFAASLLIAGRQLRKTAA
jgi:hypothetical protein